MSPANVTLATAPRTPTGAVQSSGPGGGVDHDWRLVAPWYRWERNDGQEPERAQGANRPAFHKFASTDFVTDFLRDPQRSVVFDPTLDVFQDIVSIETPEGKLPSVSRRRKSPTGFRKFFLPSHQRFYLVAIGLHCDRPGFPKVDPAKVGEVGFVIRRQRVEVDDNLKEEAAAKAQQVTRARARARAEFRLLAAQDKARSLHPFRAPGRDRVRSAPAALLKVHQQVVAARKELKAWAVDSEVVPTHDAWVATGDGSFGSWVPMAGPPEEIVERTYPMRLLTADPDDPSHAALDGTIYWGVVPTASDEIGHDGSGRFNQNDRYCIQVYAREDRGDCPGSIVWSEPSETFSLASFYDPDGCGQRPIDIQLPDFRQLEAADALPSVKFSSPPASSPHALAQGEDLDGQGSEICFWFIPLITIIAMFLLNIILPIVVFIFQLWWMLKLKFCIPPSVDFELELSAALEIEPPEFELEADFDVSLETKGNPADVIAALGKIFDPSGKEYQNVEDKPPPFQPDYDFADQMDGQFSFDSMIRMAMAQGYGEAETFAMDFSRDLLFTTPVTRDQVVHP